MQKRITVALMTTTIDGRRAKGTAVVARKCVEGLLARREEFDLTFIHYERCEDPIYEAGVREILIPHAPWYLPNKRFVRFLLFCWRYRHEQFDIMHWFQPRLYPFFFLVPARQIVVTVHGAGDVTAYNRFNVMRHVFNLTLILSRSRVRAAIAGSTYAGKDIVKYYRFDPKQVYVVNNGVEPEFARASVEEIARVRAKYELPEKFFIGVGRLIPIKNVQRCLEAFEMYCAETEERDMQYVNIGANGSERNAIEGQIRASPYSERMHLVGYVEQADLPAVYSAAYALVFPLLNEGFGLPALEAMGCGTPAIIAKTAAPEITAQDAILVDAYNTRSIADAMVTIVRDGALREQLAVRGPEVARYFSWDRMQERVVEIYREIMR